MDLVLGNGSEEQAIWIFWFTPEGRYEAAEQSNGLFVERVMLRTERSEEEPERPASNWQKEDLPGWGGPLLFDGSELPVSFLRHKESRKVSPNGKKEFMA